MVFTRSIAKPNRLPVELRHDRRGVGENRRRDDERQQAERVWSQRIHGDLYFGVVIPVPWAATARIDSKSYDPSRHIC